MSEQINLPEWVIISAVRYALGRMTYIVADTTDLVIDRWPRLSDVTKGVIRADVNESFARLARCGSLCLGMEQDVRNWQRVRALWAPNRDADC